MANLNPSIMTLPLFTDNRRNAEKIMNEYPNSAFIITLRCKYSYEDDSQWEYLTESCDLYGLDRVLWLNDWYEGQSDVEYLYITIVTPPEPEFKDEG